MRNLFGVILFLVSLGMVMAQPNPAPTVISRQPILTFMANSPAADLFVLGLQALQNTNPGSPSSWYQLAAIHGTPFTYGTGSKSGPCNSAQSTCDTTAGYCHHGDYLFPSWHRPYLLLVEQTLQAAQLQIVKNSYASGNITQAVYNQGVTLANTFRLPFWDWDNPSTSITPTNPKTLNQPLAIPTIFLQPTYKITHWVKNNITIPNPLLGYKLNEKISPVIPSNGANPCAAGATVDNNNLCNPLGNFDYTIRFPQSGFYVNVFQDDISMILSTSSYNTVSNHNSPNNNIETIHDAVHVFVGGTMSVVPIAAFDPIFFLHHCNVDRIIALWQAVYPSNWVSTKASATGAGTYSTLSNAAISSTTPLIPFLANMFQGVPAGSSPNTNYVTSAQVQSVKAWGYTYPELVQLAASTKTPSAWLAQLFPHESWVDPFGGVPGTTPPTPPPGVSRRLLQDNNNYNSASVQAVQWRVASDFPASYFPFGPITIRVFINNPLATANTPLSDPSFATTLAIWQKHNKPSRNIFVDKSITNALIRLHLINGTIDAPNVAINSLTFVITGQAIKTWFAQASADQIAQLQADIDGGIFTPSLNEYILTESSLTHEIETRDLRRSLSVPVTIVVEPAHGTVDNTVVGNSVTEEVDYTPSLNNVNNAAAAQETPVVATNNNDNELYIIVGSVVGGILLGIMISAFVLRTCLSKSSKPSASAPVPRGSLTTEIVENPLKAVQTQPEILTV